MIGLTPQQNRRFSRFGFFGFLASSPVSLPFFASPDILFPNAIDGIGIAIAIAIAIALPLWPFGSSSARPLKA